MNQRRFWLPFLVLISLATAMIAVILTPPNVPPVVRSAVIATPPTTTQWQQYLAAMAANNAAMELDERAQERAHLRRQLESNSTIDKGIVIPWETQAQRRDNPI